MSEQQPSSPIPRKILAAVERSQADIEAGRVDDFDEYLTELRAHVERLADDGLSVKRPSHFITRRLCRSKVDCEERSTRRLLSVCIAVFSAVTAFSAVCNPAFACQLEETLRGQVLLTPLRGSDWAIIKNNGTDGSEPFGRLRGEITEGRTGLEIHDANAKLVGFIYRDRAVLPPTNDSSCPPGYQLALRKTGPKNFLLVHGSRIVGHIQGDFPFQFIR